MTTHPDQLNSNISRLINPELSISRIQRNHLFRYYRQNIHFDSNDLYNINIILLRCLERYSINIIVRTVSIYPESILTQLIVSLVDYQEYRMNRNPDINEDDRCNRLHAIYLQNIMI